MPMKRLFTTYVVLFFALSVLAQKQSAILAEDNLISNPSFETFDAVPIGWFYKGQHFTRVMKYWFAASTASPDVFGQGVRVPTTWAEKGFGQQKPKTGKSMVGLTLYGCDNGKPHCREYVEIQLNEPLVIGQDYYVEFWVSHLPRSLQINNIGAWFSESRIDRKLPHLIKAEPQVIAKNIVSPSERQWVKVSGKFRAKTEGEYLLLGNFSSDSLTQTRVVCDNNFNYAYYYIDDVLVKKIPPIIEVPLKPDDITQIKLEKGKIIPLKNIYFETDKAELLPRSHIELNKLLQIMTTNAQMIIKINGHTDSQGEDEYNQSLSERRAKAVINYLNEKGIDMTRTLYEGFGSTSPIATNSSGGGRQMNRRVEFEIISLR